MSKNISIQQDGVAVPITGAEELHTVDSGGGSITWIPEDETTLGALTATGNGTYAASENGVYGFSVVIVNVPANQVTGTDTDGNDYIVTVDSGGYLVETLIPSSIAVTTAPTKTSYTEGEAINFSGLVVTAYDGNGNAFDTTEYPGGVVPTAELQFPVTRATGTGTMTVPVNWPRPGDGGILTCSFSVTVSAGT